MVIERDTAHKIAKNKSIESNSELAPERKGSQHCRRMGYHSIIPPFVGERAAWGILHLLASGWGQGHTTEEVMTAQMGMSGEVGALQQCTDTVLQSYWQGWCNVWCLLVGQRWQSKEHRRHRCMRAKSLYHSKLYGWMRGSMCWGWCGALHIPLGQPGCGHWLSIWEVNRSLSTVMVQLSLPQGRKQHSLSLPFLYPSTYFYKTLRKVYLSDLCCSVKFGWMLPAISKAAIKELLYSTTV